MASSTRRQIVERSKNRTGASKVFRESNNNDLTNIRKIVIVIELMFDKLVDRTRRW